MSDLLPLIIPVIGTLAGVGATVVLTARKSAGKIGTSEAADLWAASESIRKDLTEDLKMLRLEVGTLRAENVALRVEVTALRQSLAGGPHA